MARVRVGADIEPGPAVEGAGLDGGRVVGRQVVAEPVALIGDAPGVARRRRDGEARAIADPGGERAEIAAVRVGDEHGGPPRFRPPRGAEPVLRFPVGDRLGALLAHPLAGVRGRADRDEELLAVRREGDVARPVRAALGQAANDDLGLAQRLPVAGGIGEPHDLVRLGDIDEAWIGTGGIKSDAIGAVEPLGEDGRRGIAALGEHAHLAGAALGQEDVAVRRGAQDTRSPEPFRHQLRHEAGRHAGQPALRPRHRIGLGRHRFRRMGRRQVAGLDPMRPARPVGAPVAKCRWRLRQRRGGKQDEGGGQQACDQRRNLPE